MSKIEFASEATAYRIVLNDPPLNILDIAMLEELRDMLGRVANDKHCLIISAAGEKAFSAGASVQDHIGDRAVTMLQRFHECFRILARLDLVTVALVKGAALGGGCELAPDSVSPRSTSASFRRWRRTSSRDSSRREKDWSCC